MADYRKYEENWNEFQWEREIRRDERRISCYFRELPGCLDLPGEEDMIFSSLLSHPDLVPTGGNPDSLRFWQKPEEEEDDEAEPEDSSRRPGAEIIDEIDRLATEWNVCCATLLRSNLDLHGLGIVCAFGKLLARVADFVDTDAETARGLKISLGKRALADLNELVGGIRRLCEMQHSLVPHASLTIELLGHVRERLVDLVEQLRK